MTRLPQGYVGGPSVFQAIIENLFPENIRPYLTYYIDDILIMTEYRRETFRSNWDCIVHIKTKWNEVKD